MKRDICGTAGATGAHFGLSVTSVSTLSPLRQFLHPAVAAVTETCSDLGEAKR